MQPPVGVKLVGAKYFKDYKHLFTFRNGEKSIVDFEPIISYGTSLLCFLDMAKFKKLQFDKERGFIYWGKNCDMCFEMETYYNETKVEPIKQKGGRKPSTDKKVLLRLYVRKSIVDNHGGAEIAQEKCTSFLNCLEKNKGN